MALIVGCAAVIIIAALILFLFKDSLFGSGTDTEQPVTRAAKLESEETETLEESEVIEADIDAVRNKTSIISGKLYYTKNMDTPLVILNEPLSVYADSTSGERVFMEAVSDIYLGEHRVITSDELLLYDNVEVDISGTIWIDDNKVFIDVKKLYGEPRETESETEKHRNREIIRGGRDIMGQRKRVTVGGRERERQSQRQGENVEFRLYLGDHLITSCSSKVSGMCETKVE